MRYVDKSRLKDFQFEQPAEAPEIIVVQRDAKSYAERVYEDAALMNPGCPRQRAFAAACGLANDTTGAFREKLARTAMTRRARKRQKLMIEGVHPRMLPG